MENEMLQAVKNLFKPGEDAIASQWHRRNELTPDIWRLEQSMFQLVFIPDDMMRGMPNNHLIADAARDGETPIHPACFTLQRFTFWVKDLGDASFAIPMEKGYQPSNWLRVQANPTKIKGQLYAILSPRIKKLDIHRQNGLQFRRIRTEISLPYEQVKYSKKYPLPTFSREYLKTVEAWMYVGVPEYWDHMIGDMYAVKECPRFELNTPKFWVEDYYKFE